MGKKLCALCIFLCLLSLSGIACGGVLDQDWLMEIPEEFRAGSFVRDILSKKIQYVTIEGEGVYSSGEDFPAGFYTVSVNTDEWVNITVSRDGVDSFARTYTIDGPAEYSFYIPSDTSITLDKDCILGNLDLEIGFQTHKEYELKNMRYLVVVQMPATEYTITNIPGQDGYIVLSSIKAEEGEEEPLIIDIKNGDVIQKMFSFDDFVFIEFINCIVVPVLTVG